jgi:hypothetical protein
MSARKILPHVPPKSYTFGPDIDLCRIEAIIQHEIPARKWRGRSLLFSRIPYTRTI